MNDEHEELSEILQELQNVHYPPGVHFQRFQRYKALYQGNNDLTAIYNLMLSHSPGLRNKAALRYEKFVSSDAESVCNAPPISAKEEIAFKCPTDQIDNSISIMLKQVEEMPNEWTLVQLTPQYNPSDSINEDNNIYQTNPIHIAVFNCGQSKQDPFFVTVDAPRDAVNGNCVELAQEMMSIVKGNKEALTSHKQKSFKNHKEKLGYMSRRQSIENRLKSIIKDVQEMWLREWRCLLTGKYVDNSLEEKIRAKLTTFFKTKVADLEVPNRIISLLTCVVKGTRHLKLAEVLRAVNYCFPQVNDKVLLRRITQFVRNLGDKIVTDTNPKRHPVILILEDICLISIKSFQQKSSVLKKLFVEDKLGVILKYEKISEVKPEEEKEY